MIQARKDVSASNREQRPEEQVSHSTTQRTIHTVSNDKRHETLVSNNLDTSTAVILSEGTALGEGSTLYHRLPLGTPIQHVLTSSQITSTPTTLTETQIPINSRCAVTSTQDVTRILVTSTTASALQPVELENTVVNVSTSIAPQLQTIGSITNVAMSAQRITTSGAIFTQNPLNQRLVYHRIAPSSITGTGLPHVMLVDPSGNLGSSNEVSKVHSYSLASAPISSLSSNPTSGQTLQTSNIQHKTIIATPHNQLRTSVKRSIIANPNRSDASFSSSNCVTDIVSRLSVLNKLLSGLTISERKFSSIPSNPKKRIKLEKATNKESLIKRKKLMEYFARKIKHLQMKYYNQQVEYYFLKTGGNMVDFVSFRKKLSPDVLDYLRENRMYPHDEIKNIVELLSRWPSSLSSSVSSFILPGSSNDHSQTSKTITSNISSHNLCTSRVLFPQPSSVKLIDSSHLASQTTVTKSVKQPVVTHKQSSKHNSVSTVYDSQIGSQEEIVERAKQEAYVMQRVGDLRKEGLWSLKRLPKVSESPRIKAHWDYLLEEMVWLATDFAQERKWKKAAAKKCARMITKYFQEKEIKAEKAEKEEQLKMRKIASIMAREIKQFWSNIEKLVEYKQQTWLEEKRKKVLDVHLNFIVDQTEKYSSWLTQGMNRNLNDSPCSSRATSPTPDSPSSISQKKGHELSDFEPESSASDDEETIKKEEEDIDEEEQSKEIALLQQESEMSLEEFLDSLPHEVLRSHSQLNDHEDKSSNSNENNQRTYTEDDTNVRKNLLDDDVDFEVSEDEEDDEQTILEQEKVEKHVDHAKEIKDLEAENEMSIEQLREKYAGAYASDFKVEGCEQNEDSPLMSENESNYSSNESSEDEDLETDQNDESLKSFHKRDDGKSSPSREISDIAATAESFQPKGNTLSTTQVFTKVPFLLKHQLREYQHIGLDWLNAMYDKKLNGILADEMGLGKTIQTISLLAHLACEKGIWGPHLIVVPTSVMLNWEMEFKKWCPAFKILTYYGTPKERKQKRVGWTKPNAFHVCITSYKLVVQDHQSFRRKKWKYFILDEAQHIKNFKSQRWQMLLNFQSTHRLLLTGTPLQNNLMELWSLMHFLMPNVFQSHREFREWFVNPVTGMIEGSHEYNESLIKRLHKVLRPFLLRRLKSEVEKQLPKKYEHVIICRLSKRQRYLYDDFMSQTKTKETLATGNFMSVINILMQLRKVCNHPNMFEERPTVSPFQMHGILFYTSSLACTALEYDKLKHVSLQFLNLLLADLELSLTAFAAHRVKKFQTPCKLITEIDNMPEPPPPCPAVKMKVNFCNSQGSGRSSPVATQTRTAVARLPVSSPNRAAAPATLPPRFMVLPGQQTTPVTRAITPATAISNHPVIAQPEQYTLQLVQPGAVASLAPLGGLTLQLQPASPGGGRVQCIQSLIGGLGRMVTATTGAQWLITSVANSVAEQPQLQTAVTTVSAQPSLSVTTANATPIVLSTNIGTATVIPQVQKIGNPSVSAPFITTFNRPPSSSPSNSSLTSQANHNKPVGRVAPLNVHPPINPNSGISNHVQSSKGPVQPSKSPVVHSLTKPIIKLEPGNPVQSEKKNSLFYLDSLVVQREQDRKNSLKSLARINNFRCTACPIYGADLVEAVTNINSLGKSDSNHSFRGEGYASCLNAKLAQKQELYWDYTNFLSNLILSPEERIVELIEIIKRFVFVIAAVTTPPIQLHISHPPPSNKNAEQMHHEELQNFLAPKFAFLHPISSNMKTQFPELRLIEYDCGKLQRLALLLQELKSNQHRVLIFTQMTRMLDILEQFLNYHGHTYLRLDGLTKVEQRQALMERFNADKRIFCFILSTRSGGIGVNLTGADTVIFYDSDWNPTMDAQAQDRCHRIGQTRDVHIYRLISEKTVEENILKKANQKRILGDLAIEGGNFTTAFFKKNTIHELFDIEVMEDISKTPQEYKKTDHATENENVEKFSQSQLEQALGMAEEESDLQAAQTAHAEAVAELAEFDESIPLDTDSRENEEKSPAEEELEKLMEQLTPVEKYAVQFLESLQEPVSLEQLKEEIEAQKKDWELGHLKALKEEEERRASRLADEESVLLYGHEADNQVYFSVNGQEEMPLWAPPTPPANENDLYIDHTVSFWYDSSVMHEARLPPIFIKKEAKRQRVDPVVSAVTTARKQKVRKDDIISIPRSLFDRPTAAILKMRREVKLQKVKGLMVGAANITKPVPSFPGLKQPSLVVNKPAVDIHQEKLEWLVREDMMILQVLQDIQCIPLNLTILMPGQIPNWDLVSDAVSSIWTYRSPKACKNRFETVILPREEGKILYDMNPKKQKKTKGIYKSKNNRPMKTNQLFVQDNNVSYTNILNAKFKMVLEQAAKRKSFERPTFLQSTKNPQKLATVLAENGIDYDHPLTAMQIAANRAERIAREKQKNQPVVVAQAIQGECTAQVTAQALAQASEQQLATQRQSQQQTTVTVAGATNIIPPHQAQAVIASLAQAQQLQQVQLNKANLPQGAVTSVSLAKSLTSGIMVNASPGSASAGTFATISKALGQAGVTSISSQAGAAQNAAIAAALTNANLRNQRATVTAVGTTASMTVHEMVAAAAAAGQVRGLTTTSGNTSTAPAVVSVAGLTAVQLAASQRIAGSLSAATTVASSTVNPLSSQVTTQRNINQLTQIQAIRQTALIRHREQQNLKQQQHMKRLQTVQQQQASQQAAKVAVGAGGTLTVTGAQQRVAQQVSLKQSVGRQMTEAEMVQLMKRQQLQQQKQAQLTTAQILAQAHLQQVQPQQVSITGGTATLVKTVSAPLSGTSSVAIPVSAVTMGGVNINVSLPQGKTGAAQTKATTITNQQLRQFQIQQQLLTQAKKGSKVSANLTQLAKVPSKSAGITASSLSTPMNAVQIVQHNAQVGTTQQVKGLPAAMTVQQIQQAMKAIPQNLPVVVTATPSLPGVQQQHTSTTLRGEPGVATGSVKAQTTTLPSTTLTTSGVLKGTPAVVVGQQQTAAILQQVAASTSGLTAQQAVTLAVRAAASQAQGQQQVQIQVQQSPHSSLVSPQSQVVSAAIQPGQTRMQQLSQSSSTINIAQPVAVQSTAQASSILSSPGTIVPQMAAESTHVVMHSVSTSNSGTALSIPASLTTSQTASTTAQVVQAAIQAARQQQQQAAQQAAQQQKASPYTMRLRNPPK